MSEQDDGISRRTLLSSAGAAVGVGGFALGGAAATVDSSRVEYNRVTYAQSQEVNLRVDWIEYYNGVVQEAEPEEPLDRDGQPIVTLSNVMPGDSGRLAFGLNIDPRESSDSSAEVQMSVEVFDTPENGIVGPEEDAADATAATGELQNHVDVTTWKDTGFRVAGEAVYGRCDGEKDNFVEREISRLTGTLAEIQAQNESGSTWVPLAGVDTDCLAINDHLCVGIAWELPEDLAGVNDNVIQSDGVEFGIGFRAAGCSDEI